MQVEPIADKASAMYIVCEFFKEYTLRGKGNHQQTPFYCELFTSWEDAQRDLQSRVLEFDNTEVRHEEGKEVIYDPNVLPPGVDELHRQGERSADLMEKQIYILTAQEFLTSNQIRLFPIDSKKSSLGANGPFMIDRLENLGAAQVTEDEPDED